MTYKHVTKEAIDKLRAKGLTNAQIAKELGCSTYVIGSRDKQPLKVLGTPKELRKKAVYLYECNLTIRQVAKLTGLSYGMVHKILEQAGVKKRKVGPYPK